jgi:hypothetical protein
VSRVWIARRESRVRGRVIERRKRTAERGIVRAQGRWVVVWMLVRRAWVVVRSVSRICGFGEAWKAR